MCSPAFLFLEPNSRLYGCIYSILVSFLLHSYCFFTILVVRFPFVQEKNTKQLNTDIVLPNKIEPQRHPNG